MTPLLQQALAPETLDLAWRRLSSDRAVWRPGLTRPNMERNLLKHLLELRDEVLDGNYRPGGLRQFTLRKADGRLRVLSALTLRDKLLQRAVLTVLDPLAEQQFHVDSYAYRRGRGVQGALKKAHERIACGLDWLVDADIEAFFDTIPHNQLKKKLRAFVPDKDLLRLIEQWLDMGASQRSLFGKARGIPQGAILSPLFCNLYLHDFDQQLGRRHIRFVRYADDFLLFTPDQASAEKAKAFADKTLLRLDLKLHPGKTQITQAGPHVSFLGERLPKPPKEKIEPQKTKDKNRRNRYHKPVRTGRPKS